MPITEGYIIEREWSLYEAQQFFCSVRKKAHEVLRKQMLEEFGKMYALHADMKLYKLTSKRKLMDQMGFYDPETFETDYKIQFANRISDALSTKSGSDWRKYGFQIHIFSLPDDKNILCDVICENEQMKATFTSYPYVKPYAYTIRQLDKADTGWAKRKEVWSLALSTCQAQHMNGFLVDMLDSFAPKYIMMYAEICDVPLPSVEERAQRLAETYCEMKLIEKHKGKNYEKVLAAKETDDYKKKVQVQAEKYMAELGRVIPFL